MMKFMYVPNMSFDHDQLLCQLTDEGKYPVTYHR